MSKPTPDPVVVPAHARVKEEVWAYRMFRAFNHPERRHFGGLKCRIDSSCLEHFTGTRLAVNFVHALAERRAVKLKEVLESFEFFARVRRRLRGPQVADLCSGHGLTGILFAMFERSVDEVVLLDNRPPASHQKVLDAAIAVAPWVESKVRWVQGSVWDAPQLLAPGTGILGVHACGVRTDRCIEAAIALQAPVAVMPCCYHQTDHNAPSGLRRALGRALSIDVHRTYTLENAGYVVNWTGIPKEITPMNRVLVGTRRT